MIKKIVDIDVHPIPPQLNKNNERNFIENKRIVIESEKNLLEYEKILIENDRKLIWGSPGENLIEFYLNWN